MRWGLEESGDEGNPFSYLDAREYFWQGLTAKKDQEHQQKLALTFRSLGQVIHLIQDAAQPQHTRNDSHAGLKCPLTLGMFGPKSLYEEYVDTIAAGINYGGYQEAALIQPHHYWDDESGNGIAEFSNANFLTEGTTLLGPPEALQARSDFPLPSGADASVYEQDIQTLLPGSALHGTMRFIGTPWVDRYANMSGFNAHASSFSVFADEPLSALRKRYTLNRFCFDDALALLIPRAVGYSAGLIDFFFRGTLEIAPPERFTYLVAPYENGEGKFTKLRAMVRNATPGASADGGTLRAIVRYRETHLSDPFIYPTYATLEPTFSYAVSKPIEGVAVGGGFEAREFDFSDDPIPVKVADVSITVAYRGVLTSNGYVENDAVAFGSRDVYEPQLIDFGNSTDYDCWQSQLIDVITRTPAERDMNGDGQPDLRGPDKMYGVSMALTALDTPRQWLPREKTSFEIKEEDHPLAYAEFSRFVAVQGDKYYWLVLQAPKIVHEDFGPVTSHYGANGLGGSINRLIEENGQQVHEIVSYFGFAYRGTYTPLHDDLVLEKVLNDEACRKALPNVSRAMTQVPGKIVEPN